MGFTKWLREIVDNKPVSLSLPRESVVVEKKPMASMGLEELCRDLGCVSEAAELSKPATAGDDSTRRALLERVLAACEARYGKDHLFAAVILEPLGLHCVTLSNFVEGEAAWSRCLAIRERALDVAHSDVLRARHFLGFLHHRLGRHPRSVELFEHNLKIIDAGHLDFFHMDQMLSCLGNSYRVLGFFEKAEQSWRRILQRAETRHGAGASETAHAAFSLGNFLAGVGRFEEALAILVPAVETLSRTCTADNQKLVRMKSVISNVKAVLSGRPDLEDWTRSGQWPLQTVTDNSAKATLRLPATWQFTQEASGSLYRDVRMPQYNFRMSGNTLNPHETLSGKPASDILRFMLSRNPTAHSSQFLEITPCRAIAYYQNLIQADVAGRKDDRHWSVLDSDQGTTYCVLCTLSVLADIARKDETEVLSRVLTKEIGNIRLERDAGPAPRWIH